MDKIGILIGDTGNPFDLTIILESAFSCRRGDFVRFKHKEWEDEREEIILGRITSISRQNGLFNEELTEIPSDTKE